MPYLTISTLSTGPSSSLGNTHSTWPTFWMSPSGKTTARLLRTYIPRPQTLINISTPLACPFRHHPSKCIVCKTHVKETDSFIGKSSGTTNKTYGTIACTTPTSFTSFPVEFATFSNAKLKIHSRSVSMAIGLPSKLVNWIHPLGVTPTSLIILYQILVFVA